MNVTQTTDRVETRPTREASAFGRVFRAHLVNESRLLMREPAALIFGAVLPILAIIVMVVFPAARRPLPEFGGFSVVQTYTPTITLFATSILGLTVMPGILGSYRQTGVLRRLRTTPSSPATLLAALAALITVVGVVVAAVIVLIPVVVGVGLPAGLGWFTVANVGSLLSFVALGTVLAAVVPNPKAAAGVGNVIAAIMWFSAGMWLPRVAFPDWLITLTDLTPGGAATQAMHDATAGAGIGWQPYAVLAAWTLVAALVAVRTFRWE
ncbi:MAG: ABC transporter permease [Dermatophilus congolensis]|nr:ABC transporter permease [Dermatophilus congolensis]